DCAERACQIRLDGPAQEGRGRKPSRHALMIAEGWSLALVAWCLSALALGWGAYRGARSLIDPHWAQEPPWTQQPVRLEPKAGAVREGAVEFRAAHGGFALGLHVTGLVLALAWIARGGALVGVMAAGANAVIAVAWAGAAAGRALSMWGAG